MTGLRGIGPASAVQPRLPVQQGHRIGGSAQYAGHDRG